MPADRIKENQIGKQRGGVGGNGGGGMIIIQLLLGTSYSPCGSLTDN